MIRIKTKQVVIRGEKRYEILKIEASKAGELPLEYTDGESVWLNDFDLRYQADKEGRCLLSTLLSTSRYANRKHSCPTEKEFEEALGIITQCGDRLREINARLAIENAGWDGKEVEFVI